MGISVAETGLAEIGSHSAEGQIQARNGLRGRTDTRNLSDDEILGLGDRTRTSKRASQDAWATDDENAVSAGDPARESSDRTNRPVPDHEALSDKTGVEDLHEIFVANPEIKQAWDEAQAYREVFATPEEARAATKMLDDFKAIDALFFSPRPTDHVELARLVATLDPTAFESLARAMSVVAMSGAKLEARTADDRSTASRSAGKDETKSDASENARGTAKVG